MDSKILVKEQSIKKVNWFYFIVIIWSIFIQNLPIPANAYQYIAFLIPICVYLFINKKEAERILKPNPLNLQSIVIIFFTWLCTLPILLLIVNLYIYLFGNTLADIVTQNMDENFMINMFFTAITPAILEEILMRGIILDGYRNKSRLVASVTNGLLFGMLHLNSFQFFHTFALGFIVSYLVMATNSIFAGILLHGINNGLPIILNYLYPLNPNVGYAEDPDFFSLIIYAIIGAILTYYLIKLLYKINNISWKEDRVFSNEKIFNLPMIISILIFLGFSAMIIFWLINGPF